MQYPIKFTGSFEMEYQMAKSLKFESQKTSAKDYVINLPQKCVSGSISVVKLELSQYKHVYPTDTRHQTHSVAPLVTYKHHEEYARGPCID